MTDIELSNSLDSEKEELFKKIKERLIDDSNFENIINVINEEEIKKELLKLFKNRKIISYDDFSSITNDSLIIEVLQLFMSENGIKFEEEEKETSEAYYSKNIDDMYKEEVDKHKLLTPEDEEISEQYYIEDNDKMYKKDIEMHGVLTPEEEVELFTKLQNAETEDEYLALKEEAIHANLRLVLKVAYRNLYRVKKSNSLSFLDIVQEGNIGLIKAIDKFDVKQGYKFSTYAIWWIRQSINNGIEEKSRSIRIPRHIIELKQKIIKLKDELSKKYGKEPTHLEIANYLGVSEEKIIAIDQYQDNLVSLDSPVGDDENSTVSSFIIDDTASTEEETFSRLNKEILIDIFEEYLTDREKKVMLYRLGYNEDCPLTIEEVAKELKISKGRVRAIEKKAYSKIKVPVRKRINR